MYVILKKNIKLTLFFTDILKSKTKFPADKATSTLNFLKI